MNNINGFTFYRSYYECLIDLDQKDKEQILYAILEYVFEDKEPKFDGFKKTIWILIKPNLTTSKNKSNNAKKEQQEIKPKSNENQIEISPNQSPLDKDKEDDDDKDIDINNKKEIKKEKPKKHEYGEYKNVLLTDEELDKLKNKYSNYEELIKKLDEGIELKGYKYKNHYLAIIQWDNKDKNKQIKDNKPVWFNKNIEASTTSEKEKKELEELLKEFN